MRKAIILFISIVLFILVQNTVFAQIQEQSSPKGQNRDTVLARSVRIMANNLNLNSSQAGSVLDARQKQQKALDTLNAANNLTAEQRSIQLKQIQKVFNEKLKQVLSASQLNIYQGELKKNRDSLISRAKHNKMNIKEMDVN